MEHVVFYPGAEGAAAFKRVGSLEDAVRLVEHLRNVEGVADVSVHALTEVPVEFKAYYKVEVPAAAEQAPVSEQARVAEQAPAAEAAPAPEPTAVDAAPVEAVAAQVAPESPVAAPEPVLAGAESNGHREVSGLGFFAS